MSRFTGFLLGFALLFVTLASCDRAHAQPLDQFNVQRDGVPQFCAAGLQVLGTTYNFVGVCNTPPPQSCTAPPCLARANVVYVGHESAGSQNVDLTQWAPVWGRIQANAPPQNWPLTRGATPQWVLPRTNFTCTKFHTTGTTGTNVLSMSSYNTAGNVEASIARTCGDFSMANGCHKKGVGAYASSFLTYQNGIATTDYKCGTTPNADWYLNLRWTDGAPSEPGGGRVMCNAQGCKIAITSNTSPT